ncbi:MAG: aminopeptidase P family protein [Chloroflexi bacterium]|nr:aminopeptidase P family protein [Chloroflexota bacterium]
MHWSSSPENRHPFTHQERDRRWRRLREEMAKEHVDVLVVLPQWSEEDALYTANQWGIVILPLEREPALVIGGESSAMQVRSASWIDDRSSATATGSTRVAYGEAAGRKLKEMGFDGKRVAIAGLRGSRLVQVRQPEGYANYTSVAAIIEALPNATIVNGSGIMGEARHEKSEEEVEVLRDAVRIAEASVETLVGEGKPGMTQARAYGLMLLEQLEARAETMVAWCPGGWGEDKWRYTTPPPGLIQPQWYICLEVGPQLAGYGCQIAQCVIAGDLHPEAREIFDLNLEAFNRACELMKPGNTWGEVEAGTKAVAKGTKYDITFLCHGRGLGNEGPLLIPTEGHDSTRDLPVRPNSTFILKPHAFPAGTHPPMRNFDVTWGDTVVVRQNGAERLGTRPQRLEFLEAALAAAR